MHNVKYNAYYLPKIERIGWLKRSQFFVSYVYMNDKERVYFVPKKLLSSTIKGGRGAVISTIARDSRYLLKPYCTTVMSQLLGQAFRYRLMLRVKGLGYKAYIADGGSVLNLKLGYSHIVRFKFNKFMFAAKLGIKDRMFAVEGPEWVMLTNVVARIMSLRKVDVYRGKGIFKKFQSYKVRIGRKKKK